jgi:hypothetical protein
MRRAWKITRAKEDFLQDCVGVSSCNWNEERAKGMKLKRFRMRDEDSEMNLYGVCTQDTEFEPLDDYGIGGLGCVILEFRENGQWVML